jgi:hypothetical protein
MQFVSAKPLVEAFRRGTFHLGWVVSVRLVLFAIPAAVLLAVSAKNFGFGDAARELWGTLLTLGFELVFFWWLSRLMAQARRLDILE